MTATRTMFADYAWYKILEFRVGRANLEGSGSASQSGSQRERSRRRGEGHGERGCRARVMARRLRWWCSLWRRVRMRMGGGWAVELCTCVGGL